MSRRLNDGCDDNEVETIVVVGGDGDDDATAAVDIADALVPVFELTGLCG